MRSTTSTKLASLAFATAALCAGTTTQAATATGNMLVTAAVLSTCVVAPVPLVFADYSLGIIGNNTTIVVTCTATSPYTVALDAGGGSGATTTLRKMTSGSNTLNYRLFSDAGYTNNWGTGSEAVASTSGTGTALIKTFTVYGQIPAGQAVPFGAYIDNVQVTVNY